MLRSANDDNFWMTALKASCSGSDTDAKALIPDKADSRKIKTMHKSCGVGVTGCGGRVARCALRVSGYAMLDVGCWILDAGYTILDTGHLLSVALFLKAVSVWK